MFFARSLPFLLLIFIIPRIALSHVGFDVEIDEITARINADPGNAELYWLRGDVNRIYEHWDRALADFKEAGRLDPDLNKTYLGIGRTYYDQAHYREATTYLDQFLANEPGNIRGLLTRARARHRLGQYLQAAADYTLAIEQFQPPQKPTPEFYLERARALEAAGERYIDDAVQGLEDGLQVLGPIITLELYIVELQAKHGHYDAALQRMDRIIDRSTRKEAYLVRRSEILMQAGRSDEARQGLLSAADALDKLPGSQRNTRAAKQMRSRINGDLDALDR
jgi:tetratricopeptide (TPR) repeat protein